MHQEIIIIQNLFSLIQESSLRSILFFLGFRLDIFLLITGFLGAFIFSTDVIYAPSRMYRWWYRIRNTGYLFLTLSVSWFIALIIKIIVARPRPFVLLDISDSVSVFTKTLEPFFSFPSGHATIFGALTYCVWVFNRPMGILVGIATLGIGIGRIVFAVHYPSDVFFGLILGWFLAWTYRFFYRKIRMIISQTFNI